jgi:hypothetical protein
MYQEEECDIESEVISSKPEVGKLPCTFWTVDKHGMWHMKASGENSSEAGSWQGGRGKGTQSCAVR